MDKVAEVGIFECYPSCHFLVLSVILMKGRQATEKQKILSTKTLNNQSVFAKPNSVMLIIQNALMQTKLKHCSPT